MNPEEIVRKLAAADEPVINRTAPPPPHYTPGEGVPSIVVDVSPWCALCGDDTDIDPVGIAPLSVAHLPSCPWRLAREWVEKSDSTLGRHLSEIMTPDYSGLSGRRVGSAKDPYP